MRTHRVAGSLRAVTALVFAAVVLGATAERPATAADSPGPVARLQVVLKQVTIHDDREGILSGDGEMTLYTGIWRCNEGRPPPCTNLVANIIAEYLPGAVNGTGVPVLQTGQFFNAGTGDTVALDRELPGPGDRLWGADTAPELGFPVYDGQPTVIQFGIREWDGDSVGNLDEYLGAVTHVVDTGASGLGVGTHTTRSVASYGSGPGDFTITYEIRRVPLPDLRPVNIQVHDLPGSAEKRVCMAVQNIEVGHAGAFEVALRVNGVVPPDGRYTIGTLASGTHYLACVETALPTSGQHVLAAVVDAAGAVSEFNEANNVYEQAYRPTAPEPAAVPTASPGAATSPSGTALPDLAVRAIEVNGRVPNGKGDCKDGKSSVTVVVENQGPGPASDVVVRLVVDDDADGALEKRVKDGLDAGEETSVTFSGVRLTKGQHSLAATADVATGTDGAESDEANNTRTVTARCTNAS